MRITKSGVYDQFRCLAERCPDSCCKEWEVEVDDASAKIYFKLPGALGDRLRQVMKTDDGGQVSMTIENGRCPMWRQDGLCRIQAELGHDALCKTCREFPRLTHDYGDFVELGLELSCPEAARLILTGEYRQPVTCEVPGGEKPEYDRETMDILLSSREQAIRILNEDRPFGEALALLLLYGYHVQGLLDGAEKTAFEPETALESAREFARTGEIGDIVNFFAKLEILTDVWKKRLQSSQNGTWCPEIRRLAIYGVERYWLQAVSDYDLVCRVKMVVISCVLVKKLGGDPVETAQLYSKEIENSGENVEAILDAAYANPAFTDDKLLYFLLKNEK